MYSFSYLEPVCCSMSSSNCCFLTCIQVSQEAGQVVWYSHLFQNFPQFIVIHTVKGFGIVNKAEIDVFLELSCFFIVISNCSPSVWAGERSGNSERRRISALSVQSLNRVWLFVTPWTTARQASLSITNSQNPPKPMSIESGMPSNHLILCCPLLLLPSMFPSIRVFSKESALRIMCPKYWSFSFNISPSNEHPGLISFRMDRLDLLVVQGTLKSLLQHHCSKASILRHRAFFIVQLSHPYMNTGKTIALTNGPLLAK